MVFSPKFCYFYYEYTMRIGFNFALKYFSLHGLQESIIFHRRTNMHPRWSRKTSLFRKTQLSALKKNCTSVSNLENSYSWHRPIVRARSLPWETHSPQMQWVTNRKTIPLMTVTSQWCPQECCQDNNNTCWVTDTTFCMDCTGGALPSEHLPLSQTAERLSHVHWC